MAPARCVEWMGGVDGGLGRQVPVQTIERQRRKRKSRCLEGQAAAQGDHVKQPVARSDDDVAYVIAVDVGELRPPFDRAGELERKSVQQIGVEPISRIDERDRSPRLAPLAPAAPASSSSR